MLFGGKFMENLNFVDIFMLILLVIFTLEGYLKGFVLSAVNLFRSVAGYFLCFVASSKLTPIIYDNYVRDMMYNKISVKIENLPNLDDIIKSIESTVDGLPDFLSDVVDVAALQTLSRNNAVEFMMNSIVEPIANIVIRIIVFAVVFILFFAITSAIISLIKQLKKIDKSKLKIADRIGGGLFGLVKCFVVLCAIVSVVNIIAPYSSSSESWIVAIKSSTVFNFVDKYNLFNVILGGL